MKFQWCDADNLATVLSIGDRIEYRRSGFFSFRPTKWAICLEVQGCSLNNNLSPPRAKNIRLMQLSKKGEKLGTCSLEAFVADGEARINNPKPKVTSEKPKESFSTIKNLWRSICNYISNGLHRIRSFVAKNRSNIFTVGTAVGLAGISISLASISPTASVIATLFASGTLILLYFDPYRKRFLQKKPSPKPPVAHKYIRTPSFRKPYSGSRSKGYRSI